MKQTQHKSHSRLIQWRIKIKILLLDCETAPNLVHTWGLFNQNVSLNQIIDAGYTLCWSAKWLGEKKIFSSSLLDGREGMLNSIHDLLDQADAVVSYNGVRFDIPTLNKEFIKIGLNPPAPYKQIDLLQTARRQFKFASNKLDYVAQFLGVGAKLEHRGHILWKECMEGNKKAMQEMIKYNKHDVILLESVYEKLKPWIKSHANFSVYTGELVCPTCGSSHSHSRGFAYTSAGKYQRFNCQGCGAWYRGNKTQAATNKYIGI